MLVLSRKCNESVVIGAIDGTREVCRVTVLGIHHGKVQLGFEVNDDVPVHRSEVWERISTDAISMKPDFDRSVPAS